MTIRFLLVVITVACFCFLPLTMVSASAQQKPKAADLVKDGQLIDLSSSRYYELFKELRTEHNFTQQELDQVFRGVTISRRVLELMDAQWEARPYYQYYPRFITGSMVRKGKKMLREHRVLLDRIEKEFGVEREILMAIWGIESRFGRNKGSFNMFRTLNSMFDAYPRRSAFYRQQLIEFLLLCRENNVDPLTVVGSFGGAFGQTQFIPSSFREYAVDFDQDGRRDVWYSVPDVLASIANYLRRFHWSFGAPIYWELGDTLNSAQLTEAYQKGRRGLLPWQVVRDEQGVDMPSPQGNRDLTIVGLELKNGGMRYVAGYPNFQAITKWNNSNRYAMAVTELAARML